MKSQKSLIKNKIPIIESNYEVEIIYRIKKNFILNSVNLETDDEIIVAWNTYYYRNFYFIIGTNKFISNFEMETSMFKFIVEKYPDVFNLVYEKIEYNEHVR